MREVLFDGQVVVLAGEPDVAVGMLPRVVAGGLTIVGTAAVDAVRAAAKAGLSCAQAVQVAANAARGLPWQVLASSPGGYMHPIQPSVDRPPPQLPQPTKCGLCGKICDQRSLTSDLFRGWLCVGCVRTAPDPAH